MNESSLNKTFKIVQSYFFEPFVSGSEDLGKETMYKVTERRDNYVTSSSQFLDFGRN